jgi:hypothetical protein
VSGQSVRRLVVGGLLLLRKGGRLAVRGLRGVLQIVLALLILFEEWGWRPLAAALARLARWRPWAALEQVIARLPPYLALVAFALPSALLLPLKFFALVLIGRGYYLTSVALFILAKAVATALVARLFLLTQPALMRIGWFAWGYNIIMPWKEALIARVRASAVWRTGRALKWRAQRALAPYIQRLKPIVLARVDEVRGFLRALLGRRRDPQG